MNALLLHLVSVAVLALAVESACRLGRFRPAICHALWLVVLVKLIVPPVVAWPVTPETVASLFSTFETASDVSSANRDEHTDIQGTMEGEWALGYGQAGRATILGTGEARRIDLEAALIALWALGSLAVAGRIVVYVRRGRRRIAAEAPLPGWLQSQLAESCATLGVSVPRALVTQEPGAVYVQITGRPVLVISAEALEHVDTDHWHTILTHELAHLKRRDRWVAWLMLAAGAVWWWNPCFWWVRKRVHLFSEMACDAWVVNVHPEARKQYAETMVRIMAMLSRQDAPAPAMGLAAWSASTQERRLWMIMKAKGACNVPWRFGVALSALAMLSAPSWLALGAEEAPAPVPAVVESVGGAASGVPAPETPGWSISLTPSEEVKKKLAANANIEFQDIHLKDIVNFIQDSFELNLVLDQRVVKPGPVGAGEASPESALTNEGGRPLGGAPYATDGMVSYISLRDTPLKEALTALLRPMELTCQIRGQAVWISTPEQWALDQVAPLPSAAFSDAAILDKLNSPINIEFENIHLKDIVEFIQDSFEINIVLDDRVILPQGKDWRTPPLGSPGYATDGMVGYIQLKNIPMGEALYHITRLLNLTYSVTKDYVYISTPERAGSPDAVKAAE